MSRRPNPSERLHGTACSGCFRVTKCRNCQSASRRSASTQTKRVAEFSLERYLGSDELADVEFVVEPQLFPGVKGNFKAHRTILAMQNDVFKAMFFGSFGDNKQVTITDLHPDGVQGLLKFFYSGKLEPKSVYEALCIRSAANKYLVTKLAGMCLDYIARFMKPEHVCPVLDYVSTTGEDRAVTKRATELIRKYSSCVLCSAAFKASSEGVVAYVIDHVRNVPEAFILGAVYTWGMQQCCRQELNGRQASSLRTAVSPLFPKMRFLALTAVDFVRGSCLWGLLDDREALCLLCNIIRDGSVPMPAGFSRVRAPRV